MAQGPDDGEAAYDSPERSDVIKNVPSANPDKAKGNPSHWLGRNKFIRSHWVRLGPSGELKGKLKLLKADGSAEGLNSLKVAIYRRGEKIKEVQTNPDGSFLVEQMTSGVYALIARGPGGFAAYGLHVLEADEDGNLSFRTKNSHIHFAQDVAIRETLEISTAAVPPTFNQLKTILRRDFPQIQSHFVPREAYQELLRDPNVAIAPKPELADEERKADPCAVNGEYRRLAELIPNGTKDSKTEAATSLEVHDVKLEADGLLRGRLYGIDPDWGGSVEIEAGSTTVTLIQNDTRIDSTPVKAEGEFDFYGLEPGVYSLIAIGKGGFGAISFRAVNREGGDTARNWDSKTRLVQDLLFDDEPTPAGQGFGNQGFAGTAFPFAMALINEPLAIKRAVEPIRPNDIRPVDSLVQGDFMGNEFAGDFTGNEFVGNEFGGEFAPNEFVGNEFGGEFAGNEFGGEFVGNEVFANEFVGGEIAPSEFLQPGTVTQPPVTMGTPPQFVQPTFQGVAGGGGGIAGIGPAVLGVGLAAGLSSIDDDPEPVSPFAP